MTSLVEAVRVLEVRVGEPELWDQLGIDVIAKPLPDYALALKLAVSRAVA